jgi:hypothetical protein
MQVAVAFVRGGAEDSLKAAGVAGSGVGATVDAVTADSAGMVLRHTLTAMGPYVRCKTGVIGANLSTCLALVGFRWAVVRL